MTRIEVVFLAGQSNADGRAPASSLPPATSAPRPDILLYSHLHGESANADGSLGRLEALRTGRAQFPPGAFGPEILLGHTLAGRLATSSPSSRLAIIKYAKGGSSLHADWRAGEDSTPENDGPHYRVFQKVARDGLAALSAAYPGAEIHLRALAWIQGESDVSAPDHAAAAYAQNLETWILDLRSTLSSPRLPVFIARLSAHQLKLSGPESPDRTRFAVVRAAQEKIAATLPGVVLVPTDDPAFTFLPDKLHFDAAGQAALGTALAKAITLP